MSIKPGSYFAAPVTGRQSTLSNRASRYRKPRKRGRADDEDSPNVSEDQERGLRSVSPIFEDQNDPVEPGVTERSRGTFPHSSLERPSNTEEQNRNRSVINESLSRDLAELKPPLYSSGEFNEESPDVGCHKHHLSVLISLLHRCLAEEDYIRASRAWGLLLRSELYSADLEMRTGGWWSIGAEILAKRENQSAQPDRQQDDMDEDDLMSNDQDSKAISESCQESSLFTSRGWSKAKDYFDRLIIEFPSTEKAYSHATSVDFYPAMFAMWIHVIHGREVQHRDRLTGDLDHGLDIENEHGDDVRSDLIGTLEEARGIAQRLDDLLSAPPYMDSSTLWHLRGMVALWVRTLFQDLVEGSWPPSESDATHMAEGSQSLTESGQRELKRAIDAFDKVSSLGGLLSDGLPLEITTAAKHQQ